MSNSEGESTAKKCSRSSVEKIEKVSDLKGEPKNDKCHVYYIHRDGTTYCRPNKNFEHGTENDSMEINGSPQRGDVSPIVDDEAQNIAKTENAIKTQEIEQCADDRLVLVHFPKSRLAQMGNKDESIHANGSVAARPGEEENEEGWEEPKKNEMPKFLADHLKGICKHCECKKEILWRNFHRTEQHFDACFRYFDEQKDSGHKKEIGAPEADNTPGGEETIANKPHRQNSLGKQEPQNKCFLKLYSLRVPCLSETKRTTVVLSLVYHTRVVGNDYVSLNDQENPQVNKEHMFGFIAGFNRKEIGKLLRDRLIRWQDIAKDHVFKTSAALTPRLLIATVLAQFGEAITLDVIKAAETLQQCDKHLESAIKNLSGGTECLKTTESIQDLNEKLIKMNRDLTGTRSTMHYLGSSADFLVNRYATYDTYVTARIMEWREDRKEDVEALKKALYQLDIWREAYRDKDKNEIVRKSMDQYKTDIKSLQQHIDITVGMVRNLIAERDRGIQLKVLQNCADILQNSKTTLDNSGRLLDNSDKQASNIRYLAFLTALLLPGTSMAIFLTTPMFPWDPFDSSGGSEARLKSFKIYWCVTAPTSAIIFLVLLFFIADDLEDGSVKTWIMKIRPKWRIFLKRQNSMRRDNVQSSTAIANSNVDGEAFNHELPQAPEVAVKSGHLRHTLLRLQRNQHVGNLA